MKSLWLLILLFILLTNTYLEDSIAAPQLVLSVSLDIQYGEKEGEATITVTGKVMDPYNQTIQGAAISTQLVDPSESSIHVSILYSKADGSYLDNFTITKAMPGNYTLNLKVSKAGYDDATFQAPLIIISKAFNLKISPVSRTLKQGSNASFEIMIVPNQGNTLPQMSVKVIGLPQRITYNLLNKSATTPRILILTLITRSDTPVGLYNFTIIGESIGFSSTTWGVIEVAEVPIQTTTQISTTSIMTGDQIYSLSLPIAIIIIIGSVASIFIFGRFKLIRALKRIAEELKPSVDKEYLATARILARLEELRANNKIDEETYGKLKKEYEEKLSKARRET